MIIDVNLNKPKQKYTVFLNCGVQIRKLAIFDLAQSELLEIKQDLDEFNVFLQNDLKTSNNQENENDDLTQLILMGFDKKSPISALKTCENNIHGAIDLSSEQLNDISSENNDFEMIDRGLSQITFHNKK